MCSEAQAGSDGSAAAERINNDPTAENIRNQTENINILKF